MALDYSTVTELAGDEIAQEQLDRLCHRYYWAGTYCAGKDVVEAACGTGPGLGYLAARALSLRAGDFTSGILAIAQRHYGNRVDLRQFDAQDMPFDDNSKDVIILFEALYYLPSAEKFINECRRVLRDNGMVLIATANKDLYDFNPSPYSTTQYGVIELKELFTRFGFDVECYGYFAVQGVSWWQKLLRPIKKMAVLFNLIPKTMSGKRFLKRVVFGKPVKMPAEIEEGMVAYKPPVALSLTIPDREYKVIYCAARLHSPLT